MREFACFYWRCLRYAFPGAWATTWIISAIFAIGCSSLAFFLGPLDTAMNLLVGLVPLTIFLAIMIAGPLVAAFLINRDLQKQLSSLQSSHTEQMQVVVTEKESLQAELDKARRSDPHRNAVRHAIQDFIRRFELLGADASTGASVMPDRLYLLEHEANQYLNQHLPAYGHFTAEYPIIGSWSGGTVLSAEDVIRRCQARLKRLRECLEFLQ